MDDRKQRQEKKKPNSNGNGRLNKERTQKEFEFCKVCNLNHDLGRRHNYYPNHAKSLSSLLFRFLKKLADVRFFLKHPTFLRPEHASLNQLWCIFCDLGIEELHSSFACRNAITHLASLEHLKSLKFFLWKYGGGMDQIDSFRVSEEDLVKWDNRCKSLKSEAAPIDEGSYGLCLGLSKEMRGIRYHFQKSLQLQMLVLYHMGQVHFLYRDIVIRTFRQCMPEKPLKRI